MNDDLNDDIVECLPKNVEKYQVRVEYDAETGHRVFESWVQNGYLHRPSAPAVMYFSRNTGALLGEEYWQNGKRHCENGPAIINRDHNTGTIIFAEYYLEGRKQSNSKGPVI